MLRCPVEVNRPCVPVAVSFLGWRNFGFSGSSGVEYISAYYTGRLNDGTMQSTPVKYFAGKDYFFSPGNFIWGDYSYTSLDPDGLTFWTIQQYAETRYVTVPPSPTAWGTRIGAATPF